MIYCSCKTAMGFAAGSAGGFRARTVMPVMVLVALVATSADQATVVHSVDGQAGYRCGRRPIRQPRPGVSPFALALAAGRRGHHLLLGRARCFAAHVFAYCVLRSTGTATKYRSRGKSAAIATKQEGTVRCRLAGAHSKR